MVLEFEVEYDVETLPADVSVFESPARQLLDESKCSRDRTCEAKTTASVITSPQKRNSARRILVSMTLKTSFTYESYFTNGTVDSEKGEPRLFGIVDIQECKWCVLWFTCIYV